MKIVLTTKNQIERVKKKVEDNKLKNDMNMRIMHILPLFQALSIVNSTLLLPTDSLVENIF